jgi:tRNA-specific 2-thiouridylase
MFPLGGDHKTAVRAEAAERGLYVAKKPDSHDVCFIPDGDTKGFLAGHLGAAKGPIVDTSGKTVGEHDGAFGYTIGQRRGLRIGDPAGDGRPRYVLDISPVTNTVTVGTAEDLDVSGLAGIKLRWCGPEFTGRIECHVQLRAHGDPVAATAERTGDDTLEIELREPVRGLAPGQAAVLYAGTRVIGSATVSRTVRTVRTESQTARTGRAT